MSIAQLGGIDLDVDGFVDLGIDEDAGKGGVAAGIGIEGRLAHQAVHAGFRAQVAVGIVAADLERCGLDAGDLALGFLQDLDPETLVVAVLQVHALEHLRPVLRLGAARAGLDVDEAVVRVERVGEHAPELQRRDIFLEAIRLAPKLGRAWPCHRPRQPARRARWSPGCPARRDPSSRRRPRATSFPCRAPARAAGCPTAGVFELAVQGFETGLLGRVVKDTSAAQSSSRSEVRER